MGKLTLTLDERTRFWSYVAIDSTTDCWLWTKSTNGVGYGKLKIAGRFWLAHRLAYTLVIGDPGKQLLCHKCDNRRCCNPYHLFVGTHKDNTKDAIVKGRFAIGSRAGGARLTETDVRRIRELYVPRKFGRYKISRLLNLPVSAVDGVIQGNWAWLDKEKL